MRNGNVSSALTVYHDGQFWVGLIEHVEDGRYGVRRIVFGAEPSAQELLDFVCKHWGASISHRPSMQRRTEGPRNARPRSRGRAPSASSARPDGQSALTGRAQRRKRCSPPSANKRQRGGTAPGHPRSVSAKMRGSNGNPKSASKSGGGIDRQGQRERERPQGTRKPAKRST